MDLFVRTFDVRVPVFEQCFFPERKNTESQENTLRLRCVERRIRLNFLSLNRGVVCILDAAAGDAAYSASEDD